MEMLKQQARIDLVHVPYKGGAAAITDLLGGRVTVLFLNQDTLLPQVQAGKLRALAVASVKRNPAYPDTPTVAESGYPGFAAESWFGLSAPARTPPAVIQRLSQATAKAMASAEMRQKLEAWASWWWAATRKPTPASSPVKSPSGARPPRRPAPAWID